MRIPRDPVLHGGTRELSAPELPPQTLTLRAGVVYMFGQCPLWLLTAGAVLGEDGAVVDELNDD